MKSYNINHKICIKCTCKHYEGGQSVCLCYEALRDQKAQDRNTDSKDLHNQQDYLNLCLPNVISLTALLAGTT